MGARLERQDETTMVGAIKARRHIGAVGIWEHAACDADGATRA